MIRVTNWPSYGKTILSRVLTRKEDAETSVRQYVSRGCDQEISSVRELTNKCLEPIWGCSLNWTFPTKSLQVRTRFWWVDRFKIHFDVKFSRPPKSKDVFGKVYMLVPLETRYWSIEESFFLDYNVLRNLKDQISQLFLFIIIVRF